MGNSLTLVVQWPRLVPTRDSNKSIGALCRDIEEIFPTPNTPRV